MKRQLESIRNRAAMGGDASVNADHGAKKFQAWISAESGYHKVDADGYAPGYTLNGWGGTVGGSMEVSARTSVGLALSAMFNDLKTDSADAGKGDVDVNYVSGYIHSQSGAWSHTFVASFGLSDIKLDRTVSAYRMHGDTDGYSFGALYEVAYTKMLNEKGTLALQPVFNVQFRHAQVNGYDETGSDAGLHVDDVKSDVVTFGLGARLQAVVHENVFGRSSVVEARALAKFDAGDDTGKATNRLLVGELNREVESAKVGAIGIELGAGLTVPVGSMGGTIFVDGSAEFRGHYSNFNASVGYRINF